MNDDKPYDRSAGAFCYYTGLMVLEDDGNTSLFHFIEDCMEEANADENNKLKFIKNGLLHNSCVVRCRTDSANDATESLKSFLGKCISMNDINFIRLSCQFSLEWLNYIDIGKGEVSEPIDGYIVGAGIYTIHNLLKDNTPRLFQCSSFVWTEC